MRRCSPPPEGQESAGYNAQSKASLKEVALLSKGQVSSNRTIVLFCLSSRTMPGLCPVTTRSAGKVPPLTCQVSRSAYTSMVSGLWAAILAARWARTESCRNWNRSRDFLHPLSRCPRLEGKPQSWTLHLPSTLTPQRARLARVLIPALAAQARIPLGTRWMPRYVLLLLGQEGTAVRLVYNPFSQFGPQLELYSQLQLSLWIGPIALGVPNSR